MFSALGLCALLLTTNPYLTESRQLYESLRYEKAITRLELARKVATNTPEERRQILDLLARSYAAVGNLDAAEAAYADLLAKDPYAPSPDDAAPKIRQIYERAKEKVYAPNYVKLKQEPAPEGEVAVSVVDPWDQVTSVVLLEETDPGSFHEQGMRYANHRAQGGFTLKDPPHRFYVEARAVDGEVRAALGSSDAPVVQTVPLVERQNQDLVGPPPEPAQTPRPAWVPYAVTGVAAAALVVGAGFAYASVTDSDAAGKAKYADATRSLDSRAHDEALAANWLIGGGVLAGGAAAVFFFAW